MFCKPSDWHKLSKNVTDLSSVYFDHNATTPPAPSLRELGSRFFELWGNPSSIHWAGRLAKKELRSARQRVAELIGASTLEVIFTSGGSEANNLALKGILNSQLKMGRKKIITTRLEHPSVLRVMEKLQENEGVEIVDLKVNREGELDWSQYLGLLDESVALVSVMLVNNETGTIFPIKKMAKEAHKVGALFHTDAVQALGKIPLNVEHLGVDLASFSGHKFYALKGSGFLFCRKGLNLERQIDGGGQERHRRGGTENLLAIASLGEMARYKDSIVEMATYVEGLRDYLQQRMLAEIDGVVVNGGGAKRVANTLNVSLMGVDGESLLMNLDMQGFAVSTGAACSSGSPEPSPALRAMGLTLDEAQSSLRISLGWSNTREQIDAFIVALKKTVQRLRDLRAEELGFGKGRLG